MLLDNTLDGVVDKVEVAMARLRLYEPKTEGEGYYVAFSGGKDSCVVLDLCRRAGVKHDAHYNLTTVDPPELVQFIKREYPEAWQGRNRPKETMLQLIERWGTLPLRMRRYCCQILKERGGEGRKYIVTGIRRAESRARSKRPMVEPCRAYSHDKRMYIHPIFDWSEAEVWEYIHKYNVPYCRLYDQGFKRLGCMFCPFGIKEAKLYAAKYPMLRQAYINALDKAIKCRKAEGKSNSFDTGEEQFNWWIANKRMTIEGAQQQLELDDGEHERITMFGLNAEVGDFAV